MDDLIFFLIIGIPIVIFNIVGAIAMFRGDYYREDERVLKEHPHSKRALQIEEQRRSGTYNIYIPKDERTSYAERYCSNSNNNMKNDKGGE